MSQKQPYRLKFLEDARRWEACTVTFQLTFGHGDQQRVVRMKSDFTVGGAWIEGKKLDVPWRTTSSDKLSSQFTVAPTARLSLEDIIKVRGRSPVLVGSAPDLGMALPGVAIPGGIPSMPGVGHFVRECIIDVDYPIEFECSQRRMTDPAGRPLVQVTVRIIPHITCDEFTRWTIQKSIRFKRARGAILVTEQGVEADGGVRTTVTVEPGSEPGAVQDAAVQITCTVGHGTLTRIYPVDLGIEPVVRMRLSKEKVKLDGSDAVHVYGLVENAAVLPAEAVKTVLGSLKIALEGSGSVWLTMGNPVLEATYIACTLAAKDASQAHGAKPPPIATVTLTGTTGRTTIDEKRDLALVAPAVPLELAASAEGQKTAVVSSIRTAAGTPAWSVPKLVYFLHRPGESTPAQECEAPSIVSSPTDVFDGGAASAASGSSYVHELPLIVKPGVDVKAIPNGLVDVTLSVREVGGEGRTFTDKVSYRFVTLVLVVETESEQP